GAERREDDSDNRNPTTGRRGGHTTLQGGQDGNRGGGLCRQPGRDRGCCHGEEQWAGYVHGRKWKVLDPPRNQVLQGRPGDSEEHQGKGDTAEPADDPDQQAFAEDYCLDMTVVRAVGADQPDLAETPTDACGERRPGDERNLGEEACSHCRGDHRRVLHRVVGTPAQSLGPALHVEVDRRPFAIPVPEALADVLPRCALSTFGPNPVELFDLFGVEGEVRPLVQPELFRERWSAGRMEQMHVGMPSQPYPFGSDKVFGSSDQDLRRGDTSGDLLLDGVEG